jgi:hypothetical protein
MLVAHLQTHNVDASSVQKIQQNSVAGVHLKVGYLRDAPLWIISP